MIFLIKINVKETENPEKSGLQEFMEQSIREEKAACEDITALTGEDHTERVPEIWWVLLLSLQLSTEQHKHIRKLGANMLLEISGEITPERKKKQPKQK